MTLFHPLGQAVCQDLRVQGVLHRVFDALAAALDKRQFTLFGEAAFVDSVIAFGHRAELRRPLVDGIGAAAGNARQLELRLAYSFYCQGPYAGRSQLNAELRDTQYLDRKTGSPQGSEALATLLKLPPAGPIEAEDRNAELHVQRLLQATQQLNRTWLTSVAQDACEVLCAGLAP